MYIKLGADKKRHECELQLNNPYATEKRNLFHRGKGRYLTKGSWYEQTNDKYILFVFANHFRTSGGSAVSGTNPQLAANLRTWFCRNFMIANIFNAATDRK